MIGAVPPTLCNPMRHCLRLLSLAAVALLLAACMRTYKLDIQQGNVVSQKQISQLQRGMTKREVRYVLGTPLVTDPFHDHRWDYYYSYKPGSASDPNERRVTLVFDGDRLDHVDGDVALNSTTRSVDDDGELVASGTPVTEPIKKDKKGWWGRMLDKFRR